ncbi:hypothetical protein PanWU01x14_091520 [Parasponia andersonii]|uniref:Uncharacterized protein n=1 Tax=Parasponia andersonii TaxID=3476 RepID=A0A2P5D745_PARAD|nr:hypothetical protein PanWU01x14_091520 [Parasponia andersonii]
MLSRDILFQLFIVYLRQVYEQLDTGEVDVFTRVAFAFGVQYPPVLHIKKATLARLIVMCRAVVAKSGVKKKE